MDNEPKPSIEIDHNKITRLIEALKYKQSWKSEVPVQILSGASPDKNFKVRKNWWSALAQDLNLARRLLIDHGLLAVISDIDNFYKEFGTDEFYFRLTNKQDIEKAEFLINKVIIELENLQTIA